VRGLMNSRAAISGFVRPWAASRARSASSMPTAASEIALIEAFADTRVIGVTINHEEMTEDELNNAISEHHSQLGLPVTDPLTRPASDLVDMVLTAFPALAVVAETTTPV